MRRITYGPPGTGKTERLLKTIEIFLRFGVEPEKIGYFTFSKNAATNGKERAASKVNKPINRFPFFQTLHSFCFTQMGLDKARVMQPKNYQELGNDLDIEIVAINDLGNSEINAHLLKYDTAHGTFDKEIKHDDRNIFIDNKKLNAFSEKNPENLPWKDLDIDVVLECTGFFTSKEKSMAHINSGAKKVLISAPGDKDVDATVVFGVNHKSLKAEDIAVSNASCTTNCLAPLVKVLHDSLVIESGIMTTIHSYTNDQVLTDVFHKDLRRARSATSSLIPEKTGAAAAVGLVLPDLNGKLDGLFFGS